MSESTTNFTDLVTKTHFERIESVFKKHFDLELEVLNADGSEVRSMCSPYCHPLFCRNVRMSVTGAKRCKQDRIRSLRMSFETGQPYISVCHAGIVLCCVPVMEHDTPLGGLFFGKCLWSPLDESLESDILKRLRGLRLDRKKLLNAAKKLDVVSGHKIHEASEFLFILVYEVAGLDPRVINWRKDRSEQQSQISEVIHHSKKLGFTGEYPYQSEQELIGKVKIGDQTGAREILNSILGMIMFRNPGQLNVLKARLVELLSVLGRAAVEGGVDIDLILEKNLDYINKVIKIDTQQELCAWISKALNEFLDSVYASQDQGKMTQVRPAIEYIAENYNQQITLANIADASYLSVSRLSHLFKEQMGITLIDYLTSVRIGHAKQLLLATDESCTTICYEVGYNNQSYFTRTFKSLVGMTPRQFRQNNIRDAAG